MTLESTLPLGRETLARLLLANTAKAGILSFSLILRTNFSHSSSTHLSPLCSMQPSLIVLEPIIFSFSELSLGV